jgi:hypothetical protein
VDDEPLILPSAHRHGVSDDDILHVYRHPVAVWDLPDTKPNPTHVLVGPTPAGVRLIEIAVADWHGTTAVIHAMAARRKFIPDGWQ